MNFIPFVASASAERAVTLSFEFYLLNLLVPIIPAVIIYWLFPEGRTGGASGNTVEGSVGGWKIKAVGAWGAYVTAALLGYWTVASTIKPRIDKVGGKSAWEVMANFQFADENGKIEKRSDGVDLLSRLRVLQQTVQPLPDSATFFIVSDAADPPDSVAVTLEDYDVAHVPLKDSKPDEGKIKVPSTVVLKHQPRYEPQAALTPLPH